MQDRINVAAAPKTGTFQMRINPEVRREVEAVYAAYGLSLTDAINVFFQQSLNEEGLPFLLSPENAAYMKAKAAARRITERILDGCAALKAHPLLGMSLAAKTGLDTDLRYLVCEQRLALYRVEGELILVARILDGRTDYLRVLFREQ